MGDDPRAWGRNSESGHASNALLAETNVSFAQRDTVYGRFEIATKSAHDLVAPEPPESFTVAKVQGGYTRYLPAWNGFHPGIGAGVSVGLVPATLRSAYGSRANAGFAVYVTLRPAAVMRAMPSAAFPAVGHSQHAMPEAASSAPKPGARPEATPRTTPQPAEPRLPVLEAERVFDPACAATIDVINAPRATYQGRVYYFCSAMDRDLFVKDPAAFIKSRGLER